MTCLSRFGRIQFSSQQLIAMQVLDSSPLICSRPCSLDPCSSDTCLSLAALHLFFLVGINNCLDTSCDSLVLAPEAQLAAQKLRSE
jgi:hypothetical protein